MCCQTHHPRYVYKGSLLVQAEEEAFRCQCPCLGCPRRATGEDLRCEVCRDPAAVASPWSAVDSEGFYREQSFEVQQPRWYPEEAGGMRLGDYRRLLRESAPPGSYQPFEIEASEPLDWGPGQPEESLRLSPGAQGRVARMMREANARPDLPAGSFPVVNGVAIPRRWDQATPLKLEPQQFAADNSCLEPGSPLA